MVADNLKQKGQFDQLSPKTIQVINHRPKVDSKLQLKVSKTFFNY